MFNILIFVLIPLTLVLLSIFFTGLMELRKQEIETKMSIAKDGLAGYLDQVFGYGTAKIFKTIQDAEGNWSYLVYLPNYKWFKTPNYKWYEVNTTNNGYQHSEIEG